MRTPGAFRVGETVQLGYVDQSRDALAATKNVWEEISDGRDVIELGRREIPSRAYVSAFNFKGSDQQKKVGQLSGGERNRVHMAKLLKSGANVILLDEPTTDLDVDTLRALEDALLDFAGCAVIISHDRWFLDRICTHILAFEGDSTARLRRGQLPGLRGRPAQAPGHRRRPAAPHQVQAPARRLRPAATRVTGGELRATVYDVLVDEDAAGRTGAAGARDAGGDDRAQHHCHDRRYRARRACPPGDGPGRGRACLRLAVHGRVRPARLGGGRGPRRALRRAAARSACATS